MNRLLMTILLLGNVFISYGQISDSLFLVWQDISLADTVRLNALRQFTTAIRKTDPDSAVKLGETMVEMTHSGGYSEMEYRGFTSLGISHAFMGNYEDAIQNLQKSM